MKSFCVRSEFLSTWGDEVTPDTVITMREVERLSEEWEIPVEELLDQLYEVDTFVNSVRTYKKHVIISKKLYTIFCIPQVYPTNGKQYEFYIQPASGIYAMEYMFGLPEEQQTLQDAFEMAEEDAKINIEIYGSSWL